MKPGDLVKIVTPATVDLWSNLTSNVQDVLFETVATYTSAMYALVVPEMVEQAHALACGCAPVRLIIDSLPTNDKITACDNIEEFRYRQFFWVSARHLQIMARPMPAAQRDPATDGCNCLVCGQFAAMACANQADGQFICYSCREQPLRRYY